MYLQVQVPHMYQESYRSALDAGPEGVDLRKLSPYYFDFGLMVLRLEMAEAALIRQSLVQVCASSLFWLGWSLIRLRLL